MVISKNPIRYKLMANEHTIDQVMNFNYLRTDVSYDRHTREKVRIQGSQNIGLLEVYNIEKHIHERRRKVQIHKACVRHRQPK